MSGDPPGPSMAVSPVGGRDRYRDQLEEERDFLFRSLEDLEAEHSVGDIADDDYLTLKDDYTARAAAVLRSLVDDHRPAVPSPKRTTGSAGVPAGSVTASDADGPAADPGGGDAGDPTGAGAATFAAPEGFARRHRRPLLVAAAVCVVAAGVGYALTASSSKRFAGETITGENVGPSAITQLLTEANQAEVRGDAVTELKDVRAVLAKDPAQPEALTLEGWVLVQTQQPKLLAQGIGLLKLAEQVDPGLAQAHAYRAIALLSQGDDRAAVPELEWYLDHKPDPKLEARFRAALAKAEANDSPS